LAAAAAVLVAGACTAGDHSEGPAAGDGLAAALPPTAGINVLIVSFDALRPDHLGIYGYQRPTSPHIDAFAAESVVFDRASSAAGSTPTSFAAAFTGRLPPRVFRGWELAEAPTLASVFAAAGFETAFFANNVQLVAERGFDRGFGHYRILVGEEAGEGGGGIADDEQVLAEAQAWLRERTRTPFLAWVHFLSPHSPYSHRPMAEHFYRTPAEGRFAISTGHTFAVDSSAELERVVDLYDGQVFFGDHLFESLLDTVREAGLLDRTLIVLTSDHGEELMEHGGLQHRTVFEEVLRIPLIIRHPGVRRGRRSDAPVSNLDLLPTLAAIAGLEVPGPTDGVSLLDPIDPGRLRMAMAMTGRDRRYVALASGSQKVILDCLRGDGAFYDLAADPGEQHDLIGEHRRPYRALTEQAAAVLDSPPCDAIEDAVHGARAGAGVNAATRRRLRALGYLGGGRQPPRSGVRMWAEPNPIPVCDGLMLGETLIRWSFPDTPGPLEIRVGAPDGKLMAQIGPSGEVPTGRWVTDGMEFFAVEQGTARTVDRMEVTLTREGCSGGGEG
jgi:arylsulfatase